MRRKPPPRSPARALATVLVWLAPLSLSAIAADVTVMLSGERGGARPASALARGDAELSLGSDRAVADGNATGISGTSVRPHQAPSGEIGGVTVPLVDEDDRTWVVPVGAKRSKAQETSSGAGRVYVDVHGDGHRDRELRGTIEP